MRRHTIALALLATVAFAGSTLATDINWVGGTGTWYTGSVWDNGGSIDTALNTFDRASGWDSGGAFAPADADITIGAGGDVLFDGGVAGDFRMNNSVAAPGGSITIKDGGKLELRASVANDGEWIQYDADSLTITGAGSELNRTNVGTAFNGGAFTFGSWRTHEDQVIDINVLDGGKLTSRGQLWFGAYNDSDRIDVTMTIGRAASVDLAEAFGAVIPTSLDDTAGAGNEADLDLIYNYDSATSATQANNYVIDIDHSGSLTVGKDGIRVQTETADTVWDSDLSTYGDLWGDGILTASGSTAGAIFGDNFAVTGSSGSDGYKATGILGASVAGGADEGDINGDLLVNGADLGILVGNFGASAGPTPTVAEGDLAGGSVGSAGDDLIDILDFSKMAANFSADPGPAAPGTATAEYNPITGEIIVSADSVVTWFVESLSGGLNGPVDGTATLPAGGAVVTDHDIRIGEGGLSPFSLTDHALGAVALPFLSDLTVWYTDSFGGNFTQGVVTSAIPEPSSILLVVFGLVGMLATRRKVA